MRLKKIEPRAGSVRPAVSCGTQQPGARARPWVAWPVSLAPAETLQLPLARQ